MATRRGMIVNASQSIFPARSRKFIVQDGVDREPAQRYRNNTVDGKVDIAEIVYSISCSRVAFSAHFTANTG